MVSPIHWPMASSQSPNDQPPCSNPPAVSSSGPPGACITPSSVTNVVTTSLRISSSFAGLRCSIGHTRSPPLADLDEPTAAGVQTPPTAGDVEQLEAADADG